MSITASTWEVQGWDATAMAPTGVAPNIQIVTDAIQALQPSDPCEALYPCDVAAPQVMPPIAPGQEAQYLFKWLGFDAQTFVHLRADEVLGTYLVTNNVTPDPVSGVVTERSMLVDIAIR